MTEVNAEAYYNLGLTLTKQGEYEAAKEAYQSLLTYFPDHGPTLFQLSSLAMTENKWQEAVNYLLIIEKTYPYHFETQANLGTCYLKLSLLENANSHYEKALELFPDDQQILFNLGVVNMALGLIDNAIQYYQRVIQFYPDYFAAHNNLGVAFLAKNHVGLALQHFKEALRLEPNNEAIAYTVTMLSQDKRLLSASPAYIKNLFDAYANHYEQHLLSSLHYTVPQFLFEIVLSAKPINKPAWDIADLGCGTGLCGIVFKPIARTLTGIDLSANMLMLAKDKNIYTDLVEGDCLTGLASKIAAYDLIIAGDVLVYFGELASLFSAVHLALRKGGLFAFNTEITEVANYTMQQSGRFSHHKIYLEQLATKQGFRIVRYQKVITRHQNNEPVYGHLYVLTNLW